jgi:hypothetical protein
MAEDDWRKWFQGWSHGERLAHPDSPAGGSGPGHARPPSRVNELWPSDIPHPHSPAGKHFLYSDVLLDIGLRMPGMGKSLLLSVVSKYQKVGQPFSTALLRHYVEGSEETFDLSEIGPIPEQWQVWIVKETGEESVDITSTLIMPSRSFPI